MIYFFKLEADEKVVPLLRKNSDTRRLNLVFRKRVKLRRSLRGTGAGTNFEQAVL